MFSRRQLLQQAGMLSVAGLILPQLAQAQDLKDQQSDSPDRCLELYNIHTGERRSAVFWAQGQYQYDEIQSLDLMLRDHRANQAIAMQVELYEKMYYLQQLFNSKQPLHVISGYRAPSSNAKLRHLSHAVAENSLHTQGRAVDIRIPGVSHRHLHKAALAMHSGGVGYYPEDGFVHIDTGRLRRWRA